MHVTVTFGLPESLETKRKTAYTACKSLEGARAAHGDQPPSELIISFIRPT